MRFLGRVTIGLLYMLLIIPTILVALAIYYTIKDWWIAASRRQG